MKLEDKRAAARAATPYRDRVTDKIKSFLIKVGFILAIIVIICLISYNSYRGH